MSRAWVWLQLIIGWLPIWALFTTLILTAHPGSQPLDAALVSLRMMLAAALISIAVPRLTARLPWPHPFRLRFLGVHMVAASVYSLAWIVVNSAMESLVRGRMIAVVGAGLGPFLIVGVWLYVMVAGIAYANRAAQRTAQLEALAAQTQLAALRSQLNPHFLFNALHTVVQLIPLDPDRATRAAEQLATLLRSAIGEQHDLVQLREEWAFVQRYLEIESIRFGERLRVHADIPESSGDLMVPAFALQTLVENAIRHGAAPRVEPTDLSVAARVDARALTLTVSDNGIGASADQVENSAGTGLRRLRERLAWLHGDRARLELATTVGGGFTATLVVPRTLS